MSKIINSRSLTILGISFALILGFFIYLGMFRGVTLVEDKAGPFTLVYKEHQGSFSDFSDKLKEVQRLVKPYGVENYVLFGLYYDNPKYVNDESMLRFELGMIIKPEELKKISEIVESGDVLTRTLPEREYVTATFPYVNFLSVFIGVMKAYPALEEYAHQHGFPQYEYKETGYKENYVLEVYGRETIYYRLTVPRH